MLFASQEAGAFWTLFHDFWETDETIKLRVYYFSILFLFPFGVESSWSLLEINSLFSQSLLLLFPSDNNSFLLLPLLWKE